MIFPERAYRWNHTVMGLAIANSVLALSFSSVYGILPLFVHHLTTSNIAVGLIATVSALGVQVMPVFTAGATERLHRRLPLILTWATFERVQYLVLALITVPLAAAHPTLLLWIFFIMIISTSVVSGALTPAWVDLIARMMPPHWRGRFFGLWSAAGGLLGVGGGALAAALLHRFSWPLNFALCFGCTFVFLLASFVFLALGREPLSALPPPPRRPAAHAGYWRSLPRILRADRTFRLYLAASGLLTLAGMAASFYAVDAQHLLHLSDAAAGVYVLVLLASSTVGNLVWGYLGDAIGHKRVVEWGAFCTALAAVLALLARAPSLGGPAYVGVFLLMGLGSSGIQLTSATFLMELAPPSQRPTYTALAGLASAPFALLSPLLGGTLADRWTYAAVFVPAALCALLGGLIVAWAMPDPRGEDRTAPR